MRDEYIQWSPYDSGLYEEVCNFNNLKRLFIISHISSIKEYLKYNGKLR